MRTLVTLGVIIVLMAAALLAGTKWSKATLVPNLALDLEGGTQLILTPVPQAQASGQVTSNTISQAIDVIRNRVDATGVAEAEITSQGTGSSAKIVVSLPGHPDEETLKLVRTSAQMEFRPVLQQSYDITAATPTPAPTASDAASADEAATPAPTASADESVSSATPGATATADAAAGDGASATPTPTPSASAAAEEGAGPTSPSDTAYYVTPEVQAEFDALDCTDPTNLTGGVNGKADAAFVTCEVVDGQARSKLILGPVELEGRHITSATSGLEVLSNGTTGTNWVVNLKLDGEGTTQFAATTTRMVSASSPLNQFAVVLDGLVISAPAVNSIIPNGQAEISGSFTRTSAATLANQLSFGSLPVSFQVESEQQISATLGSESLEKGLLAGLIGLILVVIYSLIQYRALGMLTVFSLVLAAVITYLVITLLSWLQGYRLSLPGIAGIIVAIGITADSFIVYFERIRDELRDGRVLAASVEHGWARARRTILASDAVNFLAAAALYLLAIGGVRGFAFTLGLTTIIDLVIVFFFTHPMMEIISGWQFFSGGHRLSGLDPRRLGVEGVRYAGRGRVVAPKVAADDADDETTVARPATKQPVTVGASGTSGADGMTIAERRAAARRSGSTAPPPPPPTGQDDVATTEGDEH